MITVVEPQKKYKPDLGDVLWGSCANWSAPEKGEKPDPMRVAGLKINALDGKEFENQIIPLYTLSMNPLEAVDDLTIDSKFFESVKHNDPYTGFQVYGIMPSAVLTDNTEKYRDLIESDWRRDMALDSDWNKRNKDCLGLQLVGTHLMGTGYTYGCLASDGSHRLEKGKLLLSNNDWLFVYFWLWFNK